MKKFDDDTMKQSTLRHPFIKMVIVTILAIGLINVSLYSVDAGATTPQTRVIVGDTPQYMEYEGLAPTMEPWENGL